MCWVPSRSWKCRKGGLHLRSSVSEVCCPEVVTGRVEIVVVVVGPWVCVPSVVEVCCCHGLGSRWRQVEILVAEVEFSVWRRWPAVVV